MSVFYLCVRVLSVAAAFAAMLMSVETARANPSVCDNSSPVCFFLQEAAKRGNSKQQTAGNNRVNSGSVIVYNGARPRTVAEAEAMIRHIARQEGVPEDFAVAIAKVESGMNPNVRDSHAGAKGIMQVMPATARGLGYRGSNAGLRDPRVSASYGMRYLKMALRASGGNLHAAAAKYEAGIYSKRRSSKYSHMVMSRHNRIRLASN